MNYKVKIKPADGRRRKIASGPESDLLTFAGVDQKMPAGYFSPAQPESMTSPQNSGDEADLSELDPAVFDRLHRKKVRILAGTDEAGRGPLAGPLVAAAVVLDPLVEYPGLGDSKKLSQAAREKAFELLSTRALALAWEIIEASEVDKLNPLAASMLAMVRSVAKLGLRPDLVLVDGNSKPDMEIPVVTVIKGDARSLTIGAASIVAKVVRDRLMLNWHKGYPQYGFDRHKGYGTAAHLEVLRRLGPCPCHRLSYRGVLPPEQSGFEFE